jgi:hypothetical protein
MQCIALKATTSSFDLVLNFLQDKNKTQLRITRNQGPISIVTNNILGEGSTPWSEYAGNALP